jgi:hypothetical protein
VRARRIFSKSEKKTQEGVRRALSMKLEKDSASREQNIN